MSNRLIRRVILGVLLGVASLSRGQVVLRAVPGAGEAKAVRITFDSSPTDHSISEASIEFNLSAKFPKGVPSEGWEWLEFRLNGFTWVLAPDRLVAAAKEGPQQATLAIPMTGWLVNGKNTLEIRSLGLKAKAAPAMGKANLEFAAGPVAVEVQTGDKWRPGTMDVKFRFRGPAENSSEPVGAAKVFYALPTELVFPDRNVLHRIAPSSEPTILAARGETEPVQLVVEAPETAISHVKVDCAELGKFPLNQVEIRSVGYTKIKDRAWPDPLFAQPQAGVTIPARSRRAWWISVSVPREYPAGLVQGTIRVTSDGRTLAQVPLSVRVSPFTFPATVPMGLMIGCGISSEVLPLALQRHFYPEACWGGVQKPDFHLLADGGVRVDFAKFDQKVQELRSRWGMKYICLGFILGDGSSAASMALSLHPEMTDAKGKTAKVSIDPRAGAAERRRFDAILKQYASHVKEKGWLADSFVYLWDEPNLEPLARQAAEYEPCFRKAAPELQLLVVTGPTEILKKMDIFCTMSNHVRDSIPDWCEKNKKHFWIYSCGDLCHPALTAGQPALDTRVFGWIAWRFRAENMLHWAVDVEYTKAKLLSDGQTFTDLPYGGDGCVFYPAPRTGDAPLPSIRSENLRDGLEDAGMLMLAAQDARNADVLRPQVRRLVPDQFTYNSNPAVYMEVRQSLYRMLERSRNDTTDDQGPARR